MLLTIGMVMVAASTAFVGAPAVKTRTVDYTIGDQTFEGLFVYSTGSKGKLPGVLMVHNWLGISGETRRQAERMAKLGLAVFAVDVYGKGIRPAGPKEAMALAAKYKADRKLFRDRLLRGLEVLREQKEVDPTQTLAVGYCFGGTGVIELARAGADVSAVVSFHGGLDSPNPADGKSIKAKVVAFHGGDDPFVKPADLAAFEDEMRSHHVDWEMVIYGGAVHGFTDVTAGSDAKSGMAYNPLADERSFAVFTTLVNRLFPKR
jgi:dienelactone hydrolase